MLQRFDLEAVKHKLPNDLPLGLWQRLSLAVALVHNPEILILDEPTSGVDPIARDNFWRHLIQLSRQDGVTIFISTHFMNEALRCDRMSMMHAGRLLDSATPAQLIQNRHAKTLEEAFIGYLIDAGAGTQTSPENSLDGIPVDQPAVQAQQNKQFSWQRLFSYAWREILELARDPIRTAMALMGVLFCYW